MTPEHEALVSKLAANPRVAHAYLFEHRHPDKTPDFHWQAIDNYHSDHKRVIEMLFRGSGKSTLAEEGTVVRALFKRFKNRLIVGSSYERAVERLAAIKNELMYNDKIQAIFGPQDGEKWGEGKIVLRNGVCIQAIGRGQTLRGVKHNGDRPDECDLDDLEDEESVATPEAREKLRKWVTAVLIPALVPKARIRMSATPLDVDALAVRFSKDPDWLLHKVPIEYLDPQTGERRSAWPERFPLKFIDETRAAFSRIGQQHTFVREFMCEPVDPSAQVFVEEHFQIKRQHLPWAAKYAAYDPARTANKLSASTGKAVWSWVGPRLVVWDLQAMQWLPDAITRDIFDTDAEHKPVTIGVEQDGLSEFLMQPLRAEMLRRGYIVPVRAINAPRDKRKQDFIKGLQPFFNAREVEFAKELPGHVKEQFLTFPTGLVDAPNALAFALLMKPGQLIYPAFGIQHIAPELPRARAPFWLTIGATEQFTTGALVQVVDGQIRVLADWVTEDKPETALRHIVQMASMEAGESVKVCAGAVHFSDYDRIGVRAAAAKIPVDVRKTTTPLQGRAELTSLFRSQPGGRSPVLVSINAAWTLRALTGGYARQVDKKGMIEDFAVDGPYKVLMEGVEEWAGLLRIAQSAGDLPEQYATTKDGRRFVSALPSGNAPAQPLKSEWLHPTPR